MNRGRLQTILTEAARRCCAVGLLIALGVGCWALLVTPLWSQIEDANEQIEVRREHLARYLALSANEAEIKAALQNATTQKSGAEVFTARSEAIAAADLQARLTSFAVANGVAFRSARLLAAREEDNATLIGMRVHLSGKLRAMQSVIHTIENAVPFMFVEAAQMTGAPDRPPAGQSPKLMVDAQIDVYGLFQKEAVQ